MTFIDIAKQYFTRPMITLLTEDWVFFLTLAFDVFSMMAKWYLAAKISESLTSGIAVRAFRLLENMVAISFSLPFIRSDHCKIFKNIIVIQKF